MQCSSEHTFEVDPSSLEARYKDLQKRLHPDRFSVASPQEREHSADQASVVNQAFDTLKRPLKRAHYMVRHTHKSDEILV